MKFGNTNYENMSSASLILKWHLALKKNVYEEPKIRKQSQWQSQLQ